MTKSRLTILILSVIALVALTGVLVYESCLPGKVSSEHSGAVSDAVIDATENIESVVGGGESTPDKPSLSDKMKDNFSDFTYYVRKGIGHFGVLCDGQVVACCLDNDGKLALGNIFDTPIEEILASKRAVNIRDGFQHNIAVEDFCKTCSFTNKFDVK